VAKVRLVLSGESRPRWKKAGQTIRSPSSDDTDARSGLARLGGAPGPLFGLRRQRLIIRTYVLSSWLVRPVRVIGPGRIPLTVEKTRPDTTKLNRQPIQGGGTLGLGNEDF
jgi:hypothetical protein